MNRWLGLLIFAAAAMTMQTAAYAQTAAAITSGNWEDPTIWTSGVVPGASDSVLIGSNYPTGSALTATVTLTANESAANVTIGYGNSGGIGTLNLGNQSLTISGTLSIGQSDFMNTGTGVLEEGPGGSFTAPVVLVQNSNTLNFGVNDATTYLTLLGGSVANIAATGNVSTSVEVYSGSTLNLGASLNLITGLDVTSLAGAESTLNMNGYAINAPQLALGGNGFGINLENRGAITAGVFFLSDMSFDVNANDSVSQLYLNQATTTLHSNVFSLELDNGSVATTTASGNVTGASVSVNSGSTLNLGANLNVGVTIEGQNTTFNMNGYTVSGGVDLGYNTGIAVNLENRGIFVGSLEVGGTTFNLNPTDSVTSFSLNNATTTLGSSVSLLLLGLENGSVATTTSSGNVTFAASVGSGSTLNLGADLNLVNNLTVDGENVTLNMNGHAVSANDIFLGYSSGYAFNLENRGTFTVGGLFVGNTAFNLNANDSVQIFSLVNATSTLWSSVNFLDLANGSVARTTFASSFMFGVSLDSDSTLKLGADLQVDGTIDLQNGSTVDVRGHTLSSFGIEVSGNGSSLLGNGYITTESLTLDQGSSLTIHGFSYASQATLASNSILSIVQANGVGLVVDNLTTSSSQIDLTFTMNNAPNWVFGWADPNGGNWISTLETMIAEGQIVITAPEGYSIIDQGGVTYIAGGYVPEPSSLMLAAIATLGAGVMDLGRRLRHRDGDRMVG
jgi:hypothetical protein